MPSRSAIAFLHAIKDAEELLAHFDAINTKPPPPNAEVLKRAGLIMALTAWETYVEDRVAEEIDRRLGIISGSPVATLVKKKLAEDLKRLNNPTSEKTRKLFLEYCEVDVTAMWIWAGVTSKDACNSLDRYLEKRGNAAHRSDAAGTNQGHLVKRDDLAKIVRFLKSLVEKTDNALSTGLSTS